MAIIIWEF